MQTHKPELKQTSTPTRGKICLIFFLVLAVLGLSVSVHLSEIHYFTHTDPTYHSVCAINEKVNCETVAQSPYSVFLGLPISIWGVLAYSLIAAFSLWSLIPKRLEKNWPRGILFVMSLLALIASGVLAYLSFFKIDSMCIFCAMLYGINTLMFIVGLTLMIRSSLNPISAFVSDIKMLAQRPIIFAILFVLGTGSVASAELIIPAYWQHLGWQDLPDMPFGIDEKGQHWTGSKDPLVTIVEFSDYQCSHCRRAHKNMREITAKYVTEVRLVHRHQPLDNACNPDVKRSFHNKACECSKAAECAAQQGHFWAMNDALFSIQDTTAIANVDVNMIAVQLGLDKRAFDLCMESTEAMKPILKDMKEAKKRRVKGTPTFFIKSQPYEGGIPENIVKNAIEFAKKNTNK